MPFGKGRTPDKPGTFRIRPKGIGWRLSGVRNDGRRVRVDLDSESEAKELGSRLFGKVLDNVREPAGTGDWGTKTDDWGFPLRVAEETVTSVAETLNLPSPAQLQAIANKPVVVEPSKEEIEKKERRAKNAKSLMDLAGIAGAAGDVLLGRKLCEAVQKEPVKPDQKQVNDLRDSIKEALTEMFGDSEISPWKMAILLALGIPISMLIQSPKKKLPENQPANAKPDLKTVP